MVTGDHHCSNTGSGAGGYRIADLDTGWVDNPDEPEQGELLLCHLDADVGWNGSERNSKYSHAPLGHRVVGREHTLTPVLIHRHSVVVVPNGNGVGEETVSSAWGIADLGDDGNGVGGETVDSALHEGDWLITREVVEDLQYLGSEASMNSAHSLSLGVKGSFG